MTKRRAPEVSPAFKANRRTATTDSLRLSGWIVRFGSVRVWRVWSVIRARLRRQQLTSQLLKPCRIILVHIQHRVFTFRLQRGEIGLERGSKGRKTHRTIWGHPTFTDGGHPM